MAKFTAEEYTDEELLALARQNLATVLAGGVAKSIRGKMLRYADLDAIRKQIAYLERRIAARKPGGGKRLSRHGRC